MMKVFIFSILLGFGLAEHFKHMHTFEVSRNFLHNQRILITLKNKPPKTSKPPLFLKQSAILFTFYFYLVFLL